MATVKEHYNQVLADVYSWMLGGFDQGTRKNLQFFHKHNISPTGSAIAIDLGAGCGFQSIPLAQLGFTVTAIDLDAKLLHELQENSDKLNITTIQDDLINFEQHIDSKAESIICMTDTLLHLESKNKVSFLFKKVFSSLENKGKFIITFRQLDHELSELDRFIPVKSDENIIFTCFLEYEPETVKVHDLVYQKDNGNWKLNKSFYRKLRLSKQWVDNQLENIGFSQVESDVNNGLITIIATK
ncbi:bifunctional 2-polyprenyl-6-hydroxyphenol methylase/3-demethylubiquinol 3-O-methyltransferase UbiG [Pleurocapsa sp. PCC 7319]|uniref:class I SAM-dependent methyltransferase n=1 Tax=Pleurocapsa sp. PCC 7319 TaxID=118161 RepID=UPI00034D45BE|nr:class I SAM-dependent methyltransferase [Pleurocapsa sp. PCC 7319]